MIAAADFGTTFLLGLWLYAEIHYRFRWIPSRYYLEEPEILADAPARLEPDRDLPVLLLIKDAHRFPITLERVEVRLYGGEGPERTHRFSFNQPLKQPWWHRLLWLPRHFDDRGRRRLEIRIVYQCRGRARQVLQDNYRLGDRRPFSVFFAAEPLPGFPGFLSGDLHTHSSFTSDQVEFGAPPEAVAPLARACGLQFCAVTDHSYDLDDLPEDYLRNDPQLRKWKELHRAVRQINREMEEFVMIPGEEISCGNHRRRNVHLLALNLQRYVPGAGDSAEKWLRTAPDRQIEEVLTRAEPGALYFAAHLGEAPPWLQKILLGRGRWQAEDIRHPGLKGLQIWNGGENDIPAAEKLWTDSLLRGLRLTAVAGSDAHGNFNRYRQIRMPHLIFDNREQFHLFGMHRTLVRAPNGVQLPGLLAALQAGNAALSSGPAVRLRAICAGEKPIEMGGTLRQRDARILVEAVSTPEFGPLESIRLILGRSAAAAEETLREIRLFPPGFAYRTALPLPEIERGYVRAEARCVGWSHGSGRALTNPIWIEKTA